MPIITRSMSFRDKIIEPLPYKYKSLGTKTQKKQEEEEKQSRFSRFFEELESIVILSLLALITVIVFAGGFELLHNYLIKYHPHLIVYYSKEIFAIYASVVVAGVSIIIGL